MPRSVFVFLPVLRAPPRNVHPAPSPFATSLRYVVCLHISLVPDIVPKYFVLSLKVAPHPENTVLSHGDDDRLGEAHVKSHDRCGVVPSLKKSVEVVPAVVQHVHVAQVERLRNTNGLCRQCQRVGVVSADGIDPKGGQPLPFRRIDLFPRCFCLS